MIRPFLLKTFSAAEYAKGSQVDVRFGETVPMIGPRGRIANFLGVYLFGTMLYNVTDTGSGVTDWRYFLRQGFRNIKLTDNLGHVYIRDLHGDEVFDHVNLANGPYLSRTPDPSVAAIATNAEINVGLWIPFAPGRVDAQRDGAIAHPLLDDRINESAKLTFDVGTGTTLPTGGSTLVTWDGFNSLTAFALVRYGAPVVDVNWFWRNLRNDPRTEITMPDPGATMRYVVARDGIDQTGSTDMSSTYYSNWSVDIQGTAWTRGGESSIQRNLQMGMTLEHDPLYQMLTDLGGGGGATAIGANPWGIRTSTPRAIPIYYPGTRPHRAQYVSGEIIARFDRATKTGTSFFLNGFFDYPEAKTAFIAERTGIPVDKIRRVMATVGPGGVNAGNERKVPAEVKQTK